MLHHSDSCSLFRNGKRLPENITEDQRVDWLDVSAKKTSFHITIASYIIQKPCFEVDQKFINFSVSRWHSSTNVTRTMLSTL